MPKTNEIRNGAKYSNSGRRSPRRNAGKPISEIKQLKRQLHQERQAKNEAYYFIISSGNLQRFSEFSKKHQAMPDYHQACIAELFIQTTINNGK